MLHKQGKRLYGGVSDVVKEHLQKEVGNLIVVIRNLPSKHMFIWAQKCSLVSLNSLDVFIWLLWYLPTMHVA